MKTSNPFGTPKSMGGSRAPRIPAPIVAPVSRRLVKNGLVPGNTHSQADGAAALAMAVPAYKEPKDG